MLLSRFNLDKLIKYYRLRRRRKLLKYSSHLTLSLDTLRTSTKQPNQVYGYVNKTLLFTIILLITLFFIYLSSYSHSDFNLDILLLNMFFLTLGDNTNHLLVLVSNMASNGFFKIL